MKNMIGIFAVVGIVALLRLVNTQEKTYPTLSLGSSFSSSESALKEATEAEKEAIEAERDSLRQKNEEAQYAVQDAKLEIENIRDDLEMRRLLGDHPSGLERMTTEMDLDDVRDKIEDAETALDE